MCVLFSVCSHRVGIRSVVLSRLARACPPPGPLPAFSSRGCSPFPPALRPAPRPAPPPPPLPSRSRPQPLPLSHSLTPHLCASSFHVLGLLRCRGPKGSLGPGQAAGDGGGMAAAQGPSGSPPEPAFPGEGSSWVASRKLRPQAHGLLQNSFDSKDAPGSAHAGLAPAAAAYYPYEPALGQYPYDR